MAHSEAETEDGDITRLLEGAAASDPDCQARLLARVYGELKRLAGQRMAGQPDDHTLQVTALVHEAYLRLLGRPAGARGFRDRAHFFRAAAKAMRSILVDHARRRGADKRGGGAAAAEIDLDLIAAPSPATVCEVHELLDRLAEQHERVARVVELLFFTGLSAPEAARVLGTSDRTVKRDWRFGRAWLRRESGHG